MRLANYPMGWRVAPPVRAWAPNSSAEIGEGAEPLDGVLALVEHVDAMDPGAPFERRLHAVQCASTSRRGRLHRLRPGFASGTLPADMPGFVPAAAGHLIESA